MCYSKGLASLITLALLTGCAAQHLIPSETTHIQTVYRDSVVIHRDTITLAIPIETSVASKVQSSHLETTVAWSDARVDSTGLLNHFLVNKPFQTQKEIIYQDRQVISYRDSIQVREVPVEVEVPVRFVPKFYKFTLVWFLLTVIGIVAFICIKLK